MTRLLARLAALEKAAGVSKHETPGTLEYHMPGGSSDLRAMPCDKREEPEHGPNCMFKIVMRTNDGVRFMRIHNFDIADLG